MTNIPAPLPVRTPADCGGCDHCDVDASCWPTGLMLVDREVGLFGGDFVSCPVCVPETAPALAGEIARGTKYAYISYYWFVADRG